VVKIKVWLALLFLISAVNFQISNFHILLAKHSINILYFAKINAIS
jgi:hypothetical protein